MSYTLRLDARERWAARGIVVARWLTTRFRRGDPVCELDVDGERVVHHANPSFGMDSEDEGGVFWHYVAEGSEVGPWGSLLEYSTSGGGIATLHPTARRRLLRRDRYPRIFMSYRRDDSEVYAGRLHESLVRTFGQEEVFMDQFSIRAGEVFPWTIQQAVAHAEVVVALIGPKWKGDSGRDGRSRLENDFDYVRREIVCALDRGTPLVPILFPGGSLPDHSTLARFDLDGFEEYQAFPLSPRHWTQM